MAIRTMYIRHRTKGLIPIRAQARQAAGTGLVRVYFIASLQKVTISNGRSLEFIF